MISLSKTWHTSDTLNEQIEGRFNRDQRLTLLRDLEHYFILENANESITIWMDRNSENWMIDVNDCTMSMTSFMRLKEYFE